MGVPGLYGFLVRRYPFIVKPLEEEAGAEAPEVDELYVGALRRTQRSATQPATLLCGVR